MTGAKGNTKKLDKREEGEYEKRRKRPNMDRENPDSIIAVQNSGT